MDTAEQKLLTEEQAASYLGMSRIWLRTSRCKKREDAPPYIRCGRRAIRYAVEDLDAYIEQRRVEVG